MQGTAMNLNLKDAFLVCYPTRKKKFLCTLLGRLKLGGSRKAEQAFNLCTCCGGGAGAAPSSMLRLVDCAVIKQYMT